LCQGILNQKIKALIVSIREVRSNDIDSFVELYSESYKGLEEYAYTDEDYIREYFSWLLSRDPEGFLIAELDEPVGFVSCDANWFSNFEKVILGELHEIFVHPKYRGYGIGSALISRAMNHAVSKGRKIMGLWVGAKNFHAREFYRKKGFAETISVGKWIRMIKKL